MLRHSCFSSGALCSGAERCRDQSGLNNALGGHVLAKVLAKLRVRRTSDREMVATPGRHVDGHLYNPIDAISWAAFGLSLLTQRSSPLNRCFPARDVCSVPIETDGRSKYMRFLVDE